jgi:hypothetical protein
MADLRQSVVATAQRVNSYNSGPILGPMFKGERERVKFNQEGESTPIGFGLQEFVI